jgi:hypothetical protein
VPTPSLSLNEKRDGLLIVIGSHFALFSKEEKEVEEMIFIVTVKEVEECSVNNVGGRGRKLLKTNTLVH